jgi:osmotically-inducible protein OsmY
MTAGKCSSCSAETDSDFSQEEIVLPHRSHFWRIASAALLAGALSACSVTSGRETGDQYVDDATITTKVKTQLASDVGLTPANQIHVETSKRVVQLSGFVDSAAHKAEAESVARGIEGVQGVENNIIIQQ